MRISDRTAAISASPTLALAGRVKALIAAGSDIVNMAVGEPDFPAPQVAMDAAVAKIRSGEVRYTPAAGTPELRAAAADHTGAPRHTNFGPENITVCHSGKHALSGALLALINPGDEVLLPLPAWVSYVELVNLAGGNPIEIPPAIDPATGESSGARPDFAAMEAAIGPRTRGILINTPNNPSGYVWTRSEIQALCDLAEKHELWIVSDEIYRRLVFAPAEFCSPVELASPALKEHIAIVDGASKTFAMTGYRIGFLAAPPDLASAVARLHSQTTGSPNAISQAAYLEVLRDEPSEVASMATEYHERRDLLVDGLTAMGLRFVHPSGAFYVFPDVSAFCDERGADGFAADLLEQEGLALVPGHCFRQDGFVRLSYALAKPAIEEALVRLGRFIENHTLRLAAQDTVQA